MLARTDFPEMSLLLCRMDRSNGSFYLTTGRSKADIWQLELFVELVYEATSLVQTAAFYLLARE